MVFCFIALIVFGIMGIFSATHRALAREAFDCVFKKLTLTPCQTGLDARLKAKLISRTFDFSPALSRMLNAHFELFSWLFFALTVASLAYSLWGLYNWYEFGNCDGPQSTGFCIYNTLLGQNTNPAALKLPPAGTGIQYGPEDARVRIMQFGCFTCPYTKEAEGPLRSVLAEYEGSVLYEFKPFPLPSHPYSREAALAVICSVEQGKYWKMRDAVFLRQGELRERGTPVLDEAAQSAGLNVTMLAQCMHSQDAVEIMERGISEGNASGVYGTPTFFINGKAYVGPMGYDQLKGAVDAAIRAG